MYVFQSQHRFCNGHSKHHIMSYHATNNCVHNIKLTADTLTYVICVILALYNITYTQQNHITTVISFSSFKPLNSGTSLMTYWQAISFASDLSYQIVYAAKIQTQLIGHSIKCYHHKNLIFNNNKKTLCNNR